MRGTGYPREVNALVMLRCTCGGHRYAYRYDALEWQGSKGWSVWLMLDDSYGSGGSVGSSWV